MRHPAVHLLFFALSVAGARGQVVIESFEDPVVWYNSGNLSINSSTFTQQDGFIRF